MLFFFTLFCGAKDNSITNSHKSVYTDSYEVETRPDFCVAQAVDSHILSVGETLHVKTFHMHWDNA